MESRWLSMLWLGGAVGGYYLFMSWHPLHAVFATAWRTARRNGGLIVLLASLLCAQELWEFWQSASGSADGRVSPATGDGVQQWVRFAWHDLRSVFWVGVSLEMAFLVGIPAGVATLFFWVPRVWRALAARKGRWMAAGLLLILWFAALWWWLREVGALVPWDFSLMPNRPAARTMVAFLGEGVVAVIAACFVQACLWCGAYRSQVAGAGMCRLREAADLALRWAPAVLMVSVLYGLGLALQSAVVMPLGLHSEPAWDFFLLFVMIVCGALPPALILVPRGGFVSSLQGGVRFIVRTWWRYFWFVFVAWVHFSLLRLLDISLRDHLVDRAGVLLGWEVVNAALRAWIIVWMVDAFCLYFCMEAKHVQRNAGRLPRKRAKKKGGKSPRKARVTPRRVESSMT